MAVQISGNDITVPRDGSFTRNVTIGGTLTYEDVTNIDSVGLITARTGIEIGARPGVAASISVDGNMIVSGISTLGNDVSIAGNLAVDSGSSGMIDFGDITTAYGRLYADNSNGVLIGSKSNHNLVLRTNNTEKARIDTSGRLLLNTTTEGNAGADDFTIGQITGSTGITIRSGTTNNGNLYFSDGTSGDDEYRGSIQYQHANNSLHIATNAVERVVINSSGKVNIGDTQMSSNLLNIEDGTAAAIDIASHGTGGDTAYIGVKKSAGGGLTLGISNRDIIFKTGATYSSGTTFDTGTERLRITSGGQLYLGPYKTSTASLNVPYEIRVAPYGWSASQDIAAISMGNHSGATGNDDGQIVFKTALNAHTDASALIERMRIDANGYVTKPYQFHIEVSRSNDQTGYNAGANFGTPMIFNNVVRTIGTTSAALDTSTGKITVPVTGVYFLEAAAYSTTASFGQGWFTENANRMNYSDHVHAGDSSPKTTRLQTSGMHYLTANTEVGYKPYGNGESNVTIGDSVYHTWFRVTLIG